MDYRSGIDVMTTETACLSSVWSTDDITREHLDILGRGDQFQSQAPAEGAYYDALIEIDLSTVEPMIALPFHPSNAYPIREFKANMADLLHQVDLDAAEQLGIRNAASLTAKIVNGQFHVDQASSPAAPAAPIRIWSGPRRSWTATPSARMHSGSPVIPAPCPSIWS